MKNTHEAWVKMIHRLFKFYKFKINIWIWLNHKAHMQVLAFYSCHGKIIISEYCKVEVHGNMAYFSALHLTGWNQGTSCWAFQRSLGENPSRSIQGFDRVQFHAVVKLRWSFWPGITVTFYRPPIITWPVTLFIFKTSNSGPSSFHTLSETSLCLISHAPSQRKFSDLKDSGN